VQHIEDERKVLHALIVLGVLNSTHKKQRGVGGGGKKRGGRGWGLSPLKPGVGGGGG